MDHPGAGLIQGRVSFININPSCGSHSRAGLFQGWVSFKDLRYLLRLTISENLVLISQNTFKISKIGDFFSSKCPPLGKKIIFKNYFFPSGGHLEEEKFSFLNFSKVIWDINTKFSPVVNLNRYPLCTKFEGFWCIGFGFPAKNV